MKHISIILITLGISSMMAFTTQAQVNLGNIKKQAEKTVKDATKAKSGTPLTNDEIIKGLKEALNVGTNNAGAKASKEDGFFKNPNIFIPFPPDAVKIETALRNIGMGAKVDAFNKTMNRAAEEAAKQAAPIFLDAIKSMSIKDGLTILKGDDHAATTYLKTNTETKLAEKYKPVIDKALATTNATKNWTDLVNIYNKIPGVEKINPDLSKYATQKALDGLFYLVGEEEGKIRKDPAARVSDILKRVFGNK
jgi:hypothetical protein